MSRGWEESGGRRQELRGHGEMHRSYGIQKEEKWTSGHRRMRSRSYQDTRGTRMGAGSQGQKKGVGKFLCQRHSLLAPQLVPPVGGATFLGIL